MSILDKKLIDEIVLAKNCKEFEYQKLLLTSRSLNVRKALAKNPYLDTTIANKLLFDPSLNVSYRASKNKNCTIKREFKAKDLENKCVICEIDELKLNCQQCKF